MTDAAAVAPTPSSRKRARRAGGVAGAASPLTLSAGELSTAGSLLPVLDCFAEDLPPGFVLFAATALERRPTKATRPRLYWVASKHLAAVEVGTGRECSVRRARHAPRGLCATPKDLQHVLRIGVRTHLVPRHDLRVVDFLCVFLHGPTVQEAWARFSILPCHTDLQLLARRFPALEATALGCPPARPGPVPGALPRIPWLGTTCRDVKRWAMARPAPGPLLCPGWVVPGFAPAPGAATPTPTLRPYNYPPSAIDALRSVPGCRQGGGLIVGSGPGADTFLGAITGALAATRVRGPVLVVTSEAAAPWRCADLQGKYPRAVIMLLTTRNNFLATNWAAMTKAAFVLTTYEVLESEWYRSHAHVVMTRLTSYPAKASRCAAEYPCPLSQAFFDTQGAVASPTTWRTYTVDPGAARAVKAACGAATKALMFPVLELTEYGAVVAADIDATAADRMFAVEHLHLLATPQLWVTCTRLPTLKILREWAELILGIEVSTQKFQVVGHLLETMTGCLGPRYGAGAVVAVPTTRVPLTVAETMMLVLHRHQGRYADAESVTTASMEGTHVLVTPVASPGEVKAQVLAAARTRDAAHGSGGSGSGSGGGLDANAVDAWDSEDSEALAFRDRLAMSDAEDMYGGGEDDDDDGDGEEGDHWNDDDGSDDDGARARARARARPADHDSEEVDVAALERRLDAAMAPGGGFGDPCTICMDTECGAVAVTAACGHVMCPRCVMTWAAKKRECPMCHAALRTIVVLDPEGSARHGSKPASTCMAWLQAALDRLAAQEGKAVFVVLPTAVDVGTCLDLLGDAPVPYEVHDPRKTFSAAMKVIATLKARRDEAGDAHHPPPPGLVVLGNMQDVLCGVVPEGIDHVLFFGVDMVPAEVAAAAQCFPPAVTREAFDVAPKW